MVAGVGASHAVAHARLLEVREVPARAVTAGEVAVANGFGECGACAGKRTGAGGYSNRDGCLRRSRGVCRSDNRAAWWRLTRSSLLVLTYDHHSFLNIPRWRVICSSSALMRANSASTAAHLPKIGFERGPVTDTRAVLVLEILESGDEPSLDVVLRNGRRRLGRGGIVAYRLRGHGKRRDEETD